MQFIDHRKLKKKEDQSVDASDLLRRGNKILMGENTETKCRADTEGNCPTWRSSQTEIPNLDTIVDAKKSFVDRSLL